jgi:hypothetical protein
MSTKSGFVYGAVAGDDQRQPLSVHAGRRDLTRMGLEGSPRCCPLLGHEE